jgi:hypothetical protein
MYAYSPWGGDSFMRRMFMLGLVLLIAAGLSVTAVSAAPKGIDVTGEHYNLNLHFKKDTWNGGGSWTSTDRHTMFLPETPGEFTLFGCVYDVDGELIAGEEDEFENCITGGEVTLPGVQMFISMGEEWAVTDANAFDDGVTAVTLPRGKYEVYAVARGKANDDAFTKIDGWVYYEYDDGELDGYDGYYYYDLGSVSVRKQTEWFDMADLFIVEATQDKWGVFDDPLSSLYGEDGAWVFDFLEEISELYGADGGYFWQIVNGGNKLVKVRFYPV